MTGPEQAKQIQNQEYFDLSNELGTSTITTSSTHLNETQSFRCPSTNRQRFLPPAQPNQKSCEASKDKWATSESRLCTDAAVSSHPCPKQSSPQLKKELNMWLVLSLATLIVHYHTRNCWRMLFRKQGYYKWLYEELKREKRMFHSEAVNWLQNIQPIISLYILWLFYLTYCDNKYL